VNELFFFFATFLLRVDIVYSFVCVSAVWLFGFLTFFKGFQIILLLAVKQTKFINAEGDVNECACVALPSVESDSMTTLVGESE